MEACGEPLTTGCRRRLLAANSMASKRRKGDGRHHLSQPALQQVAGDPGAAAGSRHRANDRRVPERHPRRQDARRPAEERSEEHTSELQSLMRTSYAVFCLKKKKN